MEKLEFNPDEVWFTSDTHFFHENIVRFSCRPFANVHEMNEELIRRWNSTVPEDGIVFHLGDFCMGNSTQWKDILSRLHGKIYLILGNHDMRQIKQSFMQRFELVTQQMSIRVGGQSIILNHNPFLCYGGSYRDVWQLFGHVHSGPNSHTGLDIPRLKMLFPLQYDVGVDNNDFRPVSFAEVKAKIEAQVVAARKAVGLKDIKDIAGERRVVFLDQSLTLRSPEEKALFHRLKKGATDVVCITTKRWETLKEAIGKRVALIPGDVVRYVYVGTYPLDDFRGVMVDPSVGLTEEIIDAAIQILK